MPQTDHDASDPEFGAVALQQQVARDLAQAVAEEEDAGADAVGGIAQADIGGHLQLGEADIDAIEKGNDVEQKQKRHQPPGDLVVDSPLLRSLEVNEREKTHEFLLMSRASRPIHCDFGILTPPDRDLCWRRSVEQLRRIRRATARLSMCFDDQNDVSIEETISQCGALVKRVSPGCCQRRDCCRFSALPIALRALRGGSTAVLLLQISLLFLEPLREGKAGFCRSRRVLTEASQPAARMRTGLVSSLKRPGRGRHSTETITGPSAIVAEPQRRRRPGLVRVVPGSSSIAPCGRG